MGPIVFGTTTVSSGSNDVFTAGGSATQGAIAEAILSLTANPVYFIGGIAVVGLLGIYAYMNFRK